MPTQNDIREYALNAADWIYVWGANGQVYTPELADKLFRTYGSNTYTKEYYQTKLKTGCKKMAADCAGFIHPLSGYDNTANGYYNKCVSKGTIKSIPKDKVCLVFKARSNGTMHHIGIYLGDGTVAEMASSQEDYKHRKLTATNWSHWGIPNWIDYSEPIKMVEEGWKKSKDGRWWYQKADGTWFANDWAFLEWEGSKKWYFFDKDGYMMSNCVLVRGTEAFVLGPDGAMKEGPVTLTTNKRGALVIM